MLTDLQLNQLGRAALGSDVRAKFLAGAHTQRQHEAFAQIGHGAPLVDWEQGLGCRVVRIK